MKKLLALILAAALALSLVACGGDSGAGDNNTPSTGNGDTTSTDTPSGGMTKDEMLENATLLNLSELETAFEENKVRAEETYLGNDFKVFCYTDKIESDYFEYYTGKLTVIRVYMSKDKLKELNIKEGVNIVGKIDSLETESGKDAIGTPLEWKVINIKNAYYLDKTIYGVFSVNKFGLNKDGKEVCIANPVKIENGNIADIDTDSMYKIALDSETLSTLKTLNIEDYTPDFILVSGVLSRTNEAFIDQFTASFELESVSLIEIGQDEIILYLEQTDIVLN